MKANRLTENRCPPIARKVLLALFLIHFLGVISEPLRFFSRSDVRTAPEFALLGETARPYTQWLYINHGYFFFAPNPGPGHLIQCLLSTPSILEATDKKSVQTLLLPDRQEHWPRLLYHRYFMLAEFYNSRFAPPRVTEEDKKDLDFMQRWAFDKELYDQIRRSITTSLQKSRNQELVELQRIERLLPGSQQVLKEGWSLNDPRLTSILSESIEETTAPVINELPSKAGEGATP